MQSNDIDSLLEQRSLLDKLRKHARSKKIPVIEINTGYFLQIAIMLLKPVNVLEIGCGNGFSSYFILKGMDKRARYTGIDMNKERLHDARTFIGARYPAYDYEFFCGNALKIIPELDSIFDLVFIDAAKFEYPLYLKALNGKIKKGTVIIADDIFCKGQFFTGSHDKHFKNSVEGIKTYLRSVGIKNGFSTTIMDIDDGLSVSIYRGEAEVE